jgi:hypothetical protein
MARGWESKSVESQREDREAGRDPEPALTREEREKRSQRESLELSRRRVLQEIETTRSAVRRTALEQALAFLDDEIAKLAPREP